MTRMILLEHRDMEWVSYVADTVAAVAGQPWRVALERLELAPDRMSTRTHAAIVGAVMRVVGGRTRHAKEARKARELVLGHPALDPETRAARVEAAAVTLAVAPHVLETLLWADLPRERPIELVRGRPSEHEIAGHANLVLLQKAVRRAHAVTIRVWGDAGPLLRAANARGLLVSPSVGTEGETIVEIVGPLALCHRTSVYGRAISGIVPLLAACERWELVVASEGENGPYETVARSPVLLPEPQVQLGGVTRAALRLAGQLERLLGIGARGRRGRRDEHAVELGVDGSPSARIGGAVASRRVAGVATTEDAAIADGDPAAAASAARVGGGSDGPAPAARMRAGRDGPASAATVRAGSDGPAAAASAARVGAGRAGAVPDEGSPEAEPADMPSVTLAPPAMVHDGVLACPDLAVDIGGKRWFVELVGFWTTPYLERKLRGYGAANVILCIDESRACADDTPPPEVVMYRRTIDAANVLARMRPT